MATLATNQSSSENPKVNEIVDKLKKQGLFDQFRKDCLADVDTKPAYLNLRQRVENAVNRFLAVYKWRPDLNRNTIREHVRQHINESAMLSRGVDHIIEQVVEPKVEHTFKPAIDKVVFDSLGINQQEWEEKMRLKDEFERLKRAKETGVPSLLDIPSSANNNPYQQPVVTTTAVASGGVFQNPFVNFLQPGYPPPGIPGYQQFPGMLPYPAGLPGPNSISVPGIPGYVDINTALGLPSAANNEIIQLDNTVPTDLNTEPISENNKDDSLRHSKERKRKEKKKLEPLTVEDLLNIPLPKEEVKSKGVIRKEKQNEEEIVYETTEYSQVEEETVVMDTTYEHVVTEGEYSQDEQVITSTEEIQTEEVETTDNNQTDQPKVYHFAWQGFDIEQEVAVMNSDVSYESDNLQLTNMCLCETP